MNILKKKPCLGLVVSNRAFFNPALALAGRREIVKEKSALCMQINQSVQEDFS